jgi:nucleotide-binding universal stress UspA family protein
MADDLSSGAKSALLRAIVLAGEVRTTVKVIHVVPAEVHARRRAEALRAGSVGASGGLDELERMLEEDVGHALGQTTGERPPVSTSVRLGEPVSAILEEAHKLDARLLVVGAHGKDSLGDRLIGSTPDRVVGKSDRPLLVVRRHSARPYRRVLFGSDFSADAQAALRMAAALARGAEFHLLHVSAVSVKAGPPATPGDESRGGSTDTTPGNGLAARLTEMARSAHVSASQVSSHLLGGEPAEVITAQARALDADLVVVGSRGLGPFERFLFGTVSRQVLRTCPCDVLVARSARSPS